MSLVATRLWHCGHPTLDSSVGCREDDGADEVHGTVGVLPNVIGNAFLAGRAQWLEEPVIDQWITPQPRILKVLQDVNQLYHQWKNQKLGPFYPFSDALWMETAAVLREAGLPWHNNNLNLPEEPDHSWPFNFKSFERRAVVLKGARVGDVHASGYICNRSEANEYGIRALQQESRRQTPGQKPLLVAARMESYVVESASQLFGLELLRLKDFSEQAKEILIERTGGQRPMIFAATLGNTAGEVDDFDAIRELCKGLPIFLHVDASRTFDFITTLSSSARKQLGLPLLKLQHPYLDSHSPIEDDTISAATIVAAGMNSIFPPPTVVLKPNTLGSPSPQLVEYVRGTDSTLAGSRDALGPLLVYLQELRFRVYGIRDVYGRCAINRQIVRDMLVRQSIPVQAPPSSLDLIIRPSRRLSQSAQQRWGLVPLDDDRTFLITMQPSATASDIEALVDLLSSRPDCKSDLRAILPIKPDRYRIPNDILRRVQDLVSEWRVAARISGGYPLNQAPYSALGPIVGHFLSLSIPADWADAQAKKILKTRKCSFGLSSAEHKDYFGMFTTGSTMGNRIGLHAALVQIPNAFVYYSAVTHYSVKKIVRDSDDLTRWWHCDKTPHFAEIPADSYGRMMPEELVKQAMKDKSHCKTLGDNYNVILIANIGTTFVGGRDDILGLRKALHEISVDIAHIHVDGALDFGFTPKSVCLGPPSKTEKDGIPVVQGITLSHHKAFGIMVSGEVICYSPNDQRILENASRIDPRMVFETWLFQRLYLPGDLLKTGKYCLKNSDKLRDLLQAIGVVTFFNPKSIVTLIERLPPWIVQDFHLAPEGDWVHYITMPHITPTAIEHFVDTVASIAVHFATMFDQIAPSLDLLMNRKFNLKRVQPHDRISFPRIMSFVQRMLQDQAHGVETTPFCLDTFKRQYIYGGMSFTALDEDSEPLVIFLVKTTANREISLGPVLVSSESSYMLSTLQDIGFQAIARLSELFGLRVVRTQGM